MVIQKPKIVIIGAGISGLSAAKKLYTTPGSTDLFDLCVVEGGNRIGGRICTSEFCGDQIEKGATWIHGIEGSPIYKIAQEINSLESDKPWEFMEGNLLDKAVSITEDGHEVNASLVESITTFFNKLLEFSSGEGNLEDGVCRDILECFKNGDSGTLSIGSFLRKGLDFYWDLKKDQENVEVFDKWSTKSLEEGVFAMRENIHRQYTSAGDLKTLDFYGESEYHNFPGEDITIAKGYSTVIESLASSLPDGLIQLDRKVTKIEWQSDDCYSETDNVHGTNKPVKLHFRDGSIMYADHVIVTVSLGVLKQGIREDSAIFSPPLPSFKTQAISRLGFGVVDKLFLQLSPRTHDEECYDGIKFPYMHLVFHQSDPKLRDPKIPSWLRRTSFIYPIYAKSSTIVTWFAGEEAINVESLDEEEIIDGLSTTMSKFLANAKHFKNSNSAESLIKFDKALKCKWGTDPLFLGSYSYIAVGSSGDDLDAMAEPLPKTGDDDNKCPPLQILFAGEATSRNNYSTTHGAYFTGLREANRLLEHFKCVDV